MINLALVGIGKWGKNYVSTINTLKNVKIKYLCSRSLETLNLYKGDFVKTINYTDFFKYKDIDGVIIATPNNTHYEISQEFLKRGFNLLIEKPMVENYSQALALRSLQKKNASKIIVGYNYLFDPAYKKTKKLIGSIGRIRYISYEGTNNGPYRNRTSALWDIGSHAVSLCLDVHSKKPIQVCAWAVSSLRHGTEFYDFAIIKMIFSDQTEAFIKVSWLFPVKRRELTIVGDKDTIVYDAVANKKIIYYKDMIKTSDFKVEDTSVSFPKYGRTLSLTAEINEFAEAIRKNKVVEISNLELGVNITKIISLAYKSIAHDGRPELI